MYPRVVMSPDTRSAPNRAITQEQRRTAGSGQRGLRLWYILLQIR